MGYKEKFDAGESKALSHIIATKILRDLTDLRSKVETSPIVPRRWIWELIQNAKDVHPEAGVKIKINFDLDAFDAKVIFKHTGRPFSTENIRFLIEQISTKDRQKDEQGKRKTTGKFGTGFLSTHLLSEVVTINGIAKEPEEDHRKFTLVLDRTGIEPDEITEAVHTAKLSVRDLDERPPFKDYVEGEFNTEFTYPLNDTTSIKVAELGYHDLRNCLPYALIFVSEIESLEVLPDDIIYKTNGVIKELTDNMSLVSVSIKGMDDFVAVMLVRNFTNILIPVKIVNEIIAILPIPEQVPRLFCDFPLIGTEKFPFPVIINNPHFNPTDPRDGVYLTTSERTNILVEQNKDIMEEALDLYTELLEYAAKHSWKNLHLLAQIQPLPETIDWVDPVWFKKNVLDIVREKILYTPIVQTEEGSMACILTEGNHYTWFPSASKKEIRDRIWSSAKHWLPHVIPIQTEVEIWNRIAWTECGRLSVNQFSAFVSGASNISELEKNVDPKNVYDWLNDFYDLIKLEDKDYDSIINKKAIFPNQNGDFCLKGILYKESGVILDDFKDILKLLGKDIRATLIDTEINEDFPTDKLRDESFAVREILSEVRTKVNNREVAKSYAPAFKKILQWFNKNPKLAEELFEELYTNKHVLYDDNEISENLIKSEQLDELMNDFDVKDISELRDVLLKNRSNSTSLGLLKVTQEILASMGITSPEEWAKALEDKNLANLFSHESVPTPDMFFIAQSYIKKAKQRIIEHLKTLANYDLSNMDQDTAATILADITKDGYPISIVARPAYGGEVIIYYGSEQDVLDYEPSELWVDDGTIVKRVSLGHILKRANIKKFPI